MIPKILHQIHLGESPDAETIRCIDSVWRTNPGWEHRLWREKDFGLKLVVDLLRDLGSLASVSNYLRLTVLRAHGGVYLDTDVEGLKPMDRFTPYYAFAALQDTDRICNAIMGSTPQHPWIEWQIHHFNQFTPQDPASGVYLASAAPRDGLTLIDPKLVYPFSYDTPKFERRVYDETVLIHHWRASWVKK